MFEIRNLKLKLNDKIIFDKLNIKISRGELLLLCGPSGSGKTSFINCISGVIPELIKADLSGEIIFEKDISVSVQNPHNISFSENVIEELSFYFENQNVEPDEIFDIIFPIAGKYGISKLLLKKTELLSAGQKQKTSLVSRLAQNSNVIIMDEPFTLLDDEGKKVLTESITKLKNDNKIIIISEHNISQLENLIDKFLYFDGTGNYKIFDKKNAAENYNYLFDFVRTKKNKKINEKKYSENIVSLEIRNL